MNGGLNETLTAEGVWDIISYEMVPWGNAYFNTKSCGTSSYDKNAMFCWVRECGKGASQPLPDDCFSAPEMCQHGEHECKADLIEACAIHLYPDRVYAPFVHCFEGQHESDLSAAQPCAEAMGMDWGKIDDCTSSSLGMELNVANANKTAAIGDSKLGTPWVLVNGEAIDDVDNLLQSVCAAYQGDPPKGCWELEAKRRARPHTHLSMC